MLLAYLHNGEHVHPAFAESLAYTLLDHRIPILPMPSGPMLAAGREAVRARFLEGDQEWLLFVDTDMSWPGHAPVSLLERARTPIVSALTFTRRGRATFDRDGQTVAEWPKGEIVSVDSVGMGFCLIHRDVLETVEFGYDHWGGRLHAEDATFCYRAKGQGFEISVDTSILVEQHKSYPVTQLAEIAAQSLLPLHLLP